MSQPHKLNGDYSEGELQKAAFEWLKIHRVFAWRMPIGPVVRGGGKVPLRYSKSPIKGFPDIAGVLRRAHPGVLFAIELKVGDGKLTPEQVAWIVDLQAADAKCAVVRSIAELEAVMAEWGEVSQPGLFP